MNTLDMHAMACAAERMAHEVWRDTVRRRKHGVATREESDAAMATWEAARDSVRAIEESPDFLVARDRARRNNIGRGQP